MTIPKVFIDTCVCKSARRFVGYGKFEYTYNDKGEVDGGRQPIVVCNDNDRIEDPVYQRECNLVEDVAAVIRKGMLEAVTCSEVDFECMRLPMIPSSGERLFGASIGEIRSPIGFISLEKEREIPFHVN